MNQNEKYRSQRMKQIINVFHFFSFSVSIWTSLLCIITLIIKIFKTSK